MANKQTLFSTRRTNKRGRGRGISRGRGRNIGRGRSQSAATPSAPEQLVVKLKFDYGRYLGQLPQSVRAAIAQSTVGDTLGGGQQVKEDADEQPVEDEELPQPQCPFVTGHLADPFVGEPPGQTTRAGRQTKVPAYHDTVPLDSDMVEPSSVGKVDEEEDEEDEEDEYQEQPKSARKSRHTHLLDRVTCLSKETATVLERQSKANKPGQPGRPRSKAPTLPIPPFVPPTGMRMDGRHQVPAHTVAPPSPIRSTPFLNADSKTYEILDYLSKQSLIPTSLPELTNYQNPDVEEPYSAKFLTELYMIAYVAGSWNTCDLVVDTWIRMFQRVRRRADRTGEGGIWRANKALKLLRREGKVGFDPNPPKYGEKLPVEDDPNVHADASLFDRDLLARLYTHTDTNCGARALWADSMALSGAKVGQALARSKKNDEPWHRDLVHDVLCTTLRLVRRKLTLKCEEGTEGAWCRRYHEHWKRGLKCYREVAAGQVVDEEVVGRSWKRGRQEGDVGVRGKRARFEEREVLNIDAEGEFE